VAQRSLDTPANMLHTQYEVTIKTPCIQHKCKNPENNDDHL